LASGVPCRKALNAVLSDMEFDRKEQGGDEMGLAYDVFERLPDGQPMWVKAVATLDEARGQIVDLMATRGGTAHDFFVYDVRRGAEIAVLEA
jgi:hypothetical protein